MVSKTSNSKSPEEQKLNVTLRLSGKLKASGYGDVAIPEGWVFLSKNQVSCQQIKSLCNLGSVWSYWEQRTKWTSDFKGWYLPPVLIDSLHQQIQKQKEERARWLKSRGHEKECLTVWALDEPTSWRTDGVYERRFESEIKIPRAWTLLGAGDQLLTRRVKERGQYWVYRRQVKYSPVLGIFAPSTAIEEERQKVQQERATEAYARRRSQQQQRRELQEQKYRQELENSIIEYLDFAPKHRTLAGEIAKEAVAHAAQVGSGRVARTSRLILDNKAILAVRAYIRHNYTDYDNQLDEVGVPLKPNDDIYREIRAKAESSVNLYIIEHRTK